MADVNELSVTLVTKSYEKSGRANEKVTVVANTLYWLNFFSFVPGVDRTQLAPDAIGKLICHVDLRSELVGYLLQKTEHGWRCGFARSNSLSVVCRYYHWTTF